MNNSPINSIGVIVEDPIGEIDQSVYAAFSALDVELVAIKRASEWPLDLDAYLITGPFYPLGQIFPNLLRVARDKDPNIILWLTEQRPSSLLPAWMLNLFGTQLRRISLAADQMKEIYPTLAGNKQFSRLYMGTRYRLSNEIRWLKDQGMLKLLAVQTPSHQEYFTNKLGIPSKVIPYGYHRTFGRDLHLKRDIDVTFLGSLRDRRRQQIISGLEEKFQKMDIKFTFCDGSPEHPAIFREERTHLINRTKIFLNIMRQPWDDASFRMLLATPNGAMVISEPVIDTIPYQPGEHFVTAPIDQIPKTVEHYLKHEDERQKFVNHAQEKIFTKMTNSKMAAEVLVEAAAS